MWVFDENEGMNCRDITYVPGLYKIFDEILGEFIFFCGERQAVCCYQFLLIYFY